MKKNLMIALLLGTLLLSACSASDPSVNIRPSATAGVQILKEPDICQTGSENPMVRPEEIQEPEVPEEMAAVLPETESENTEIPSQAQNTGSNTNEPEVQAVPDSNQEQAKTQEMEQPVVPEPAQTDQQPEPPQYVDTPAFVPEPPDAEPEISKSIYDYAVDAEAIRLEMIALGQSMGLTHITEDDGIPCTPDTRSWASPVIASESFQGQNLKRALEDYVTSVPSVIASYGGTQITCFTIYVQDNGGGSYTFYFLY